MIREYEVMEFRNCEEYDELNDGRFLKINRGYNKGVKQIIEKLSAIDMMPGVEVMSYEDGDYSCGITWEYTDIIYKDNDLNSHYNLNVLGALITGMITVEYAAKAISEIKMNGYIIN